MWSSSNVYDQLVMVWWGSHIMGLSKLPDHFSCHACCVRTRFSQRSLHSLACQLISNDRTTGPVRFLLSWPHLLHILLSLCFFLGTWLTWISFMVDDFNRSLDAEKDQWTTLTPCMAQLLYLFFFLSEEGPWCDVQGVPSFTGVINSISFTLCGG